MKPNVPLLDHQVRSPSAFTPKALMEAVRRERKIVTRRIPLVCILDFDGDLTDWLVATGKARELKSWACFHTKMYSIKVDGADYGIVPRCIGGSYSVLIAEQMASAGARVVFGLTSAGRVSQTMPIPGLVVVKTAIRDEGTSYHYLPPSSSVKGFPKVAKLLELELAKFSLPVFSGTVWTTDAPYRETARQLRYYAKAGVLAVEMQAASLFAFSRARKFPFGMIAHVTNSARESKGNTFDKGAREKQFEILRAICRAGRRFISS